MEVSGKKQGDKEVNKGSAGSLKLLCHPCLSEGEDLEASGFCQHCQEYLCKTCIKYHRKTTLTKHHDILDKDHMPKKENPNTVKQLCTKVCEKHTLEIIKFFCKDHDTVGCGNCMVIDHKSCKVDFIPDIADTFADGQEYKDLLDNLEEFQFKVASMKERLQAEKERNADIYTEAVEEISKFRKEIEDYLDKMEQNIIAECNLLKKENEKVTKQMEEDLELFKSELDTFQESLTTHSNETADMFVKAKQTKPNLSQLKKTIERKTSCTLKRYELKRNTDLEATINRGNPFGTLDLKTSMLHFEKSRRVVEFEPVFTGTINVKMSSDKSFVNISSMIHVATDTLLCVDRNNNSVKVVDTRKNCVSSQVSLTSGPWDITAISTNEVAVTVPGIKEIQIFSFKDKILSVSRKINVNGQCSGIAYMYHQTTLIVSFVKNVKLEILDLDGNVFRTFPTSFGDGFVLKWPEYIDVCPDCFYVSDYYAKCILKLSFDGKLQGTYKNENLSYPEGVTVCKDGSVLVCSRGNNTLHLMSEDCSNGKILLTEKDGLNKPVSVCYNEFTSTLYLRNRVSNDILVFSQK